MHPGRYFKVNVQLLLPVIKIFRIPHSLHGIDEEMVGCLISYLGTRRRESLVRLPDPILRRRSQCLSLFVA